MPVVSGRARSTGPLPARRLGRSGEGFHVVVGPRRATAKPSLFSGDWCPLFTSPVVGESVQERFLNSSAVLMEDKSYRPNRRPGYRKPT